MEVIKILMLSSVWMKSFLDDPTCNMNDLPPAIIDEFKTRMNEVDLTREPEEARPDRLTVGPPLECLRPGGMAMVVQRCTEARILLDEAQALWGEVGQGLVVSISFAKHATEEHVRGAAIFLLTAKLSTAEAVHPGKTSRPLPVESSAESVIQLCKRGHEQSIVVMPQRCLISGLAEADMGLVYDDQCKKDTACMLYQTFQRALHNTATDLILESTPKALQLFAFISAAPGAAEARMPNIVAAPFGGRQCLELKSSGPFMHSFNF